MLQRVVFVWCVLACSVPRLSGCADAGTDPLMPGKLRALQAGTDPTVSQGLRHNQVGVAHLHAQDYDAAISEFDQAAALDPANYGIYVNRGIAHTRKHQYDLAVRDFDEASRLNPRLVCGVVRAGHGLAA
jgi:tetratricopeptide (TPR) repeat protein